MVESALLRYRLRVRMVPSSYKLFLIVLGAFIGGSGVFVSLSYPDVLAGLESSHIVYENTRISPVEAKNVEVKELTIEEKIAKTFPENPKIMLAVAKAESGLNPMTTNRNSNGTRDIGLFQINSVHGEDDLEMFDVDKNLVAARKIYDKQGITAWAAFNNNSYAKFME